MSALDLKTRIDLYNGAMRPDPNLDLAATDVRFVVRFFDGMDGCWTDCTGQVSAEEALSVWEAKTEGGTKNVRFDEIDYYRIFPAESVMLWSDSREMFRGGGNDASDYTYVAAVDEYGRLVGETHNASESEAVVMKSDPREVRGPVMKELHKERDWTVGEAGTTNSSPIFLKLVDQVTEVIGSLRVGAPVEPIARVIVAQLAHVHGLAPAGRPATVSIEEVIRKVDAAIETVAGRSPIGRVDNARIVELEDALRRIGRTLVEGKPAAVSGGESYACMIAELYESMLAEIKLEVDRHLSDVLTDRHRTAAQREAERDGDHGPRRAAVSLIECEEDGRILCVWNRRYQGWTLPGGMVEVGESPAEAQSRELMEETGLKTIEAVEVMVREREDAAGQPDRARLVHVFRVKTDGKPYAAEKTPIAWLTREEFVEQSPFGTFYRKAFAELPRATSATQVPPAVARSLRHLLICIGSWTSARFDQHLRNEFGDEIADETVAWLADHVSPWLGGSVDGKPLYCSGGSEGVRLRWPYLTEPVTHCERHATRPFDEDEPCWRCEGEAEEVASKALRRGDLVRISSLRGIYPVWQALGVHDREQWAVVEDAEGHHVRSDVVQVVVSAALKPRRS